MGVTEARQDFTRIVNEADTHGLPLFLVNFNKPRAVLIGYEAWEALMGKMEDLEDKVDALTHRSEPSRPIEDILSEIGEVTSDKPELPSTPHRTRREGVKASSGC